MLQFGRAICGDLATAATREWLVTNGIGGYGCGTIAGGLTRHYHGLLIAALKPPLGRTLLVTKLDEIAIYQGQTWALHCDRWASGEIVPQGYRHLERFELQGTIPTWIYGLADAQLAKQVWMEQGANTTYVRYYLQRGSGPVQLTLKALVNCRDHHHSTRGANWHMPITALPHGVKVLPTKDATAFYLVSDRGDCTPQHEWYTGYDLAIEHDRGIDPHDDHLHGATFQVTLAVGETITLAATTAPPATIAFQDALTRQHQHERQLLAAWQTDLPSPDPAPTWVSQLVLAADQFVVSRSVAGHVGKTVIAGYPWFGDWGRDTMIALPGLAIATGRPDIARPILHTFAQYIDQGMLPNTFPEAGEAPAYNTVDAVLWYFEALRAYVAATADNALVEELFPALADIIRWHQQGTRYNIHLAADGLIQAGETGSQLTWMDAKVGDWVVTPRVGKPIEINALWYNALLIMAQFAAQVGRDGEHYRQLAAYTRQGFQRFWSNELGHCYDVLDGPQGNDGSLRPNQILAIALPTPLSSPETGIAAAPLLSPVQQKAVVDVVARQLLTSYGVRSLAPHHADYQGHYGGDPRTRDGAYHQGTVWGWLIGPFVQAHWQVYRDAALASSFLAPFAAHLHSGCIGTVSEIFDGDPPFAPRGAYAQAWSVAEVLRAWRFCAAMEHLSDSRISVSSG